MKYLSLKSYFDLQKQRVFFIKPVKKKKQKKNFIYLFSKRKSSLLYVKPLYLDFQNIIHFKKSGGLCKQKNLYLRGLTGLPLNNVYMRYNYFDYNNIFDRVKFKERYNFEIFGDWRKNSNAGAIIKLEPKLKKQFFNFFYFVNIVYTFKNKNWINKKISLKNKNIIKYNKILATLLISKQCLKNIKFYLIFFKTVYKKYLLYLNLKFSKLQYTLLNENKYFLYTIDLFLDKLNKKNNFFTFKNNLFLKVKKSTLFYLNKNIKKKIIVKKKNINKYKSSTGVLLLRQALFCNFTKIAIFDSKFKSLYLYMHNSHAFVTRVSFFIKYKCILSKQFCSLLCNYKTFLKRLKKKKNLFFFNLFKNKTNKNYNTNPTFFFKNFVLYNIQYFKKYWKYFFKYKFKKYFMNKQKYLKKNHTKISSNYFCGFRVNKYGLNHVFSLYYFFSLLLNRKHWFYYYKTYMPILKLNFVSSNNLDINFKVKFFSWFKKSKLYNVYKSKLCFLNYKNKYVYIYFYNYLYFKQLAGLKFFNILNKFYLSNYVFFWNDYQYCYIDLTLHDIYTANNINNSKIAPIISNLKNNRINLIKNYLNVNFKFTNSMLTTKNLMQDFSMDILSIFAHNLNSKILLSLKYLQKNNNIIYLRNTIFKYNKNSISLYFIFKLLGHNLKKISVLKYLYYQYVLNKNLFFFKDLYALKLNSKFMFDFFYLLYSQYLALLKLIIFLLRITL